MNRRTFLKTSAAAAAAMGGSRVLPGMTARSYASIIGANEDVRIAVAGFNGRGKNHISEWSKMKGVRLVALCDADEAILDRELARLNKGDSQDKGEHDTETGGEKNEKSEKSAQAASARTASSKPHKVERFVDVRKLLDSKAIDALSIATPNHWHSLMGIWACQAGKDVYVEKPVSHNVWEGRKLVEAARKYRRIVQTGTQSRSRGDLREALNWVREGNLGKIKVSRGLCYKRRDTIGKTEGPQKVPESVNYDLWSGPREPTPLRRKKLHYDWHWVWPTGNGDIGNQGIHQMDVARWALGADRLSPKVFAVGGRFGYEDDAETPNTQFAVHDYGDALLIFEVRGLPKKPGGVMDKYLGQDVGNIVECEDGYLSDITAYDWDHKEIKKFRGQGERGESNHFQNFMNAVRSRAVCDLHADIEEGHLSSALCHTSNISYRIGKESEPDAIKEQIKGDKAAMETFERFQEHLAANNIDIAMDKAILGPVLTMDPKAERFVDNERANKLLRDEYRKPFVVPDEV
jgi:predicted dehydrogenase